MNGGDAVLRAIGDDPGANFPDLLRGSDSTPLATAATGQLATKGSAFPHATTCVALRYDGGVVMAGDRRATSGNLISHRTMEKVVQADRHSGVAIAGSAGPAMEMVKLFQLQLEHYEKVEGSSLSLDGKANQLSAMVRGNLPAAMQGMVVVPIFAGYDLLRSTAGCGTSMRPAAATRRRTSWRPARAACTPEPSSRSVIASDLDRDDAIDLAARSLWEAADADSATGGPDLRRGIFPVVASIDVDGWNRVDDDELAARYRNIIDDLNDAAVDTTTPGSGVPS